jgi:hypothetical protein
MTGRGFESSPAGRNKVRTPFRLFTITFCIGLLLALTAVPVAGQSVKIKSSPVRDISKLGKYAWKENKIGASQKPEVIAEMDRAIKDAVNKVLKQKGYVENPQAPDFLVQVSGYGMPDMKTSANPDLSSAPTTGGTFTSQAPGGAGVNIWMTVISNMSFILTERSSDEVAWQADISKKYKNPQKAIQNLDKEIQDVVEKALKDLPAHK